MTRRYDALDSSLRQMGARRAKGTAPRWSEPTVLHVPYMSKRDRRAMGSTRSKRVVTYRERYKAILGPNHFADVCSHLHKSQAAAERCRATHTSAAVSATVSNRPSPMAELKGGS